MTVTKSNDLRLFPWLHSAYVGLWRRAQMNRLPHALLLTGAEGLGKSYFARCFAQALLCSETDAEGYACRRCKSCLIYQAETHPDLLIVTPEEVGKAIKIDQIRNFCSEIYFSAQFGGYRIGIIEAADSMNLHAQNSLLKTLEEPPDKVLLILLARQSGRLLATLRSRSQQIPIALPTKSIALTWLTQQLAKPQHAESLLAFAGGAPLKALACASNEMHELHQTRLTEFLSVLGKQRAALEVAEVWQKNWQRETLEWLSVWVSDLIRVVAAGEQYARDQTQAARGFVSLVPGLSLPLLFRYLDWILQIMQTTQALNAQLLVEDLLIKAADLYQPPTSQHDTTRKL